MKSMSAVSSGRSLQRFFRQLLIVNLGVSCITLSDAQGQEIAGLEEILVTARKREESLQSAPVSVTAFSGEGLAQRSVTSFNSINNHVPNIEVNNGRVDGGGTTAQIFIRGVGQDDYAFPLDPGVGVYLDGVYVSRSSAGDFGFMNIERIEVLRGPQGTLYGKNTIGGAVNVVTRRPTGSNSGHAEAIVGRFDRMDFNAYYDARISDNLSAGIAASTFNRDGIGRSVAGDDLGNQNRDSIRGQLRYQPSNSLDIIMSLDKSRQRQFGPLGSLRAFFDFALAEFYNQELAPAVARRFGLVGDQAVYGPAFVNPMDQTKHRFSGAGTRTRDDNDVWGASLTIDYELGDLALKSITAYREVEFQVVSDADQTPFDIVGRHVEEESEQLSQEFQISGDLLAGRLPFIVGLYAIREEGRNHVAAPILTGIEDILGDIISQETFNSIKSTSYAAFGEFTYNVTSQFGITLGGRINYDKKRFKTHLSRLYSKESVAGPFDVEDSWTEFLPKIGLEYEPTDDITAYVNYSRGYKAGGWNPRTITASTPKSFDPEYLTAYEVGLKTSLFDNRATFNMAAFYSDYKDIQLSAVTMLPDGAPDTTVLNGGKARIYGAEIELNARPTSDLMITAGLGYLNAKYKELDESVMAVGIMPDNKLAQVPELTFNAQATYSLSLSSGAKLLFSGDVAHKSKIHRSVQNFPELLTPSYWVFNSRITFVDAADRFEVAAFITNITNELYLVGGVDVRALGFVESYYSRPREWGLSTKVRF